MRKKITALLLLVSVLLALTACGGEKTSSAGGSGSSGNKPGDSVSDGKPGDSASDGKPASTDASNGTAQGKPDGASYSVSVEIGGAKFSSLPFEKSILADDGWDISNDTDENGVYYPVVKGENSFLVYYDEDSVDISTVVIQCDEYTGKYFDINEITLFGSLSLAAAGYEDIMGALENMADVTSKGTKKESGYEINFTCAGMNAEIVKRSNDNFSLCIYSKYEPGNGETSESEEETDSSKPQAVEGRSYQFIVPDESWGSFKAYAGVTVYDNGSWQITLSGMMGMGAFTYIYYSFEDEANGRYTEVLSYDGDANQDPDDILKGYVRITMTEERLTLYWESDDGEESKDEFERID